MLKLGWFLFTFGLLALIGGAIFVVGSYDALPLLEPYVCPENDTLVRQSSPNYDGGENISFFCQDDDGGERSSADGKIFLVIAVMGSPLMLSLVLIVWGSIRQTGSQQAAAIELAGQFTQLAGRSGANARVTDQGNLADRLKQLEDAYEAGLVTQEEFQLRKRQLLDDFVGN